MSDPLDALPALLAAIDRPGDFHTAGRLTAPLPLIEVADIGPVGFPLLDGQARRLLAIAEPAPYGRGAETLVDRAVRRAGQLGPERLRIDDAVWQPTLAAILDRVRTGLGVDGEIRAELYKMLVYGPGDFFVEHRDTEKAPGMFATLVVLLPARWRGGELVVRHEDREAVIDVGGPSPGAVGYAAFYADCRHELRPIREGHRLALVYSLCRRGEAPAPPDNRPQVEAVAERLRAWVGGGGPSKLLLPLSHRYTPASLGFAALKGADAARAEVVRAAAARADCAACLAMVSIEEEGLAEPLYFGGHGRWHARSEDDAFEVIEVFDTTLTVHGWRGLDEPAMPDEVPFDSDELRPRGALRDEPPDEQRLLEATGNEGATFERSYHRAAIVLWPRAGLVQVIAQAPVPGALTALRRMLDAGDTRAAALASAMIARWPTARWRRAAEHTAALFEALVDLDDPAVSARALRALLPRVPMLPAQVAPLVTLITRTPEASLDDIAPAAAVRAGLDGAPWFTLLTRLSGHMGCTDAIRTLAATCVARLPNALRQGYDPIHAITPALVAELVCALIALDDPHLMVRAMAHVESHPDVYDADVVLVPAALDLAARLDGIARSHPAFEALRALCLEHIDARLADPPRTPTSWRQTPTLRCTCHLCAELADFMRADERIWTCKVAKDGRRHLYQQIASARCDIDARTIRTGRPFTWEATKNRDSYRARVEQRARDAKHRALLAEAMSERTGHPPPLGAT